MIFVDAARCCTDANGGCDTSNDCVGPLKVCEPRQHAWDPLGFGPQELDRHQLVEANVGRGQHDADATVDGDALDAVFARQRLPHHRTGVGRRRCGRRRGITGRRRGAGGRTRAALGDRAVRRRSTFTPRREGRVHSSRHGTIPPTRDGDLVRGTTTAEIADGRSGIRVADRHARRLLPDSLAQLPDLAHAVDLVDDQFTVEALDGDGAVGRG